MIMISSKFDFGPPISSFNRSFIYALIKFHIRCKNVLDSKTKISIEFAWIYYEFMWQCGVLKGIRWSLGGGAGDVVYSSGF